MKYLILVLFVFIGEFCNANTKCDTLLLFNSGYLYRADSAELLPAKVPGSVYSDLYRNKKIADPFFSDNEKNVSWVQKTEWIYIDTFLLSENNLKATHIELLLEGIDTYADVFLNDTKITSCNNMFLSYLIDVKRNCRQRNILKIKLHPVETIIDSLATTLPYKLPGGNRVFARKAAFNFGWDFAPDLRAGGIWKPVKIICRNSLKVEDIHFVQKSLTSEKAKGQFGINIFSDEKTNVSIRLTSAFAQVERDQSFNVEIGENKLLLNFEVENPKVWNTNGAGDIHLYDFLVEIREKGESIFKQNLNIGFRELKLVREKDKIGESFYFNLNGRKVFCKGANVVPPEYFVGTATDSSWESLVEKAASLNMNMLRVWGGGVYPPEAFYTACDKRGILVWQDFMFACAMYPGDSAFISSVTQETKQAIFQYRNHPSLALWCGNNESIEGWYNWGWQKEFQYSKSDSTKIISDYKLLFEKVLADQVALYDSKTSYWPSSPSIGWGRKESMLKGDSHYWGVWWGMESFDKYKEKVPRFMSEYGFQSLPTMPTIIKFAGSGPIDLSTSGLNNHQKHPTGFETIKSYSDDYYRLAKDFRAQVYLSNILQAKGLNTAISAHRSGMPNCMGTLIWQLNDCWPGISWSAMDYYGREKAAFYDVKKDFENVIISSELRDRKLSVKLISDSSKTFLADLIIRLIDFDGNVRWSDKIDVVVKPDSSELVYNKNIKQLYDLIDTTSTMLVVELSYEGKAMYRSIHYFAKEKNLSLKRPSVSMKRLDVENKITRFEISVNYLAKNVELSIKNETGGFSDNYFDMIPDTKYTIYHYSKEPLDPSDGLNIRSLVDTY